MVDNGSSNKKKAINITAPFFTHLNVKLSLSKLKFIRTTNTFSINCVYYMCVSHANIISHKASVHFPSSPLMLLLLLARLQKQLSSCLNTQLYQY